MYLIIGIFFNIILTDDESKFTYLLGTTKGPQHWSMIKSEWKLCETGKFQSPINIRNEIVKITTVIPHLKPNYKNAPAMIVNRGHDIKVRNSKIFKLYTLIIYIDVQGAYSSKIIFTRKYINFS